MSVANGSFETAGSHAGEAASWTLRTRVRAWRVAPFGAAPALGFESFAWAEDVDDLVENVSLVRAEFDAGPEGVEDFEEGWSNDDAAFAFAGERFTVATFGAGAEAFEAFEAEWSNDAWTNDWTNVVAVQAALGGAGDAEVFDWSPLLDQFSDAVWDDASFLVAGGAPGPAETFEGVWTAMTTL